MYFSGSQMVDSGKLAAYLAEREPQTGPDVAEGQPQAVKAWQVLLLFGVFLGWELYYLLALRPKLNAWLAHYVNSYPAMLHLVPILGVPILAAIVMGKIFGWENSKK